MGQIKNYMEFRTPVKLTETASLLDVDTRVLSLGSCFADHIGERLHTALPEGHVLTNPFGVLYNPLSIARVLETVSAETYEASGLDRHTFCTADGAWSNWMCSTKLSAESRDVLHERLVQTWQQAHALWQETDLLVVTFSTDSVYVLKNDGHDTVVANCHKQPAALFEEQTADAEETFSLWNALLASLKQQRNSLRVVFTLSPYRYAKCGMHRNALIKARLLLLIDRLCTAHPTWTAYFPAFEILNDELRDYRFYEADMLHPSAQAVDYVWQTFRTWAFTPRLANFAREKEALLRMEAHRPIRKCGAEYEKFEARKAERLAAFRCLEAQLGLH